MEQNTSLANASNADPPGGTQLVLTATNNSSVPGEQYFNVFPPPLTVMPEQPQTAIPMVSTATVTGAQSAAPGPQSIAVLKWPSPPTLALIALKSGQSVDTAALTAVTLGSTVAVTWVDDGFVVTPTPGTGNTIKLTFGPGIPVLSSVGLVVGPGPILVPIAGASMTLAPNLTPTFMVQFGTAWQPGSPSFSDVSTLTSVAFTGTEAAIVVGANNLIVQTA
jgi:hypothetical protein